MMRIVLTAAFAVVAGIAWATNGPCGDLLPPKATARLGSTRLRHLFSVDDVRFCASGKSLISVTRQGEVALWDAKTGRKLSCFEVPLLFDANCNHFGLHSAFTADGKLVAVCTNQNVQLIDTQSGAIVRAFGDGTDTRPGFSGDGKILVTQGSDRELRLRQTSSGALLHRLSVNGFDWSFSPDGRVLAVVGKETIRLWEVASGKERAKVAGRETAVFTPDARFLATRNNDSVVVYDLLTRSKRHFRVFQEGALVASHVTISVSPNGRFLAAGGYGQKRANYWTGFTYLWDLGSGKKVLEYHEEQQNFERLVFTPDSRTLIHSSRAESMIRAWNVADGKETFHVPGGRAVLSPDGTVLAGLHGERVVRLRNATTGQDLLPMPGSKAAISALAWTRDGKKLAAASHDGTIRIWNRCAHKDALVINAHGFKPDSPGYHKNIHALTFSPDGARLASGGGDKTVRLWDTTTGTKVFERKLTHNYVTNVFVALANDGKMLAYGDAGETCLWDLHANKAVYHTEKIGAADAAFTPDGKHLALGGYDSVRVLEVSTGQSIVELENVGGERRKGRNPPGIHVAFSPDGKQVAAVSGTNEVRIFDWKTNTKKQTLTGTQMAIQRVEFSPDGKSLATVGVGYAVGADGKTRLARGSDAVVLWELATGKERLILRGHEGGVRTATFAPDGKMIASAGEDTTILLWNLSATK